jgi:hypothetical protein
VKGKRLRQKNNLGKLLEFMGILKDNKDGLAQVVRTQLVFDPSFNPCASCGGRYRDICHYHGDEVVVFHVIEKLGPGKGRDFGTQYEDEAGGSIGFEKNHEVLIELFYIYNGDF